MANKFSDIKTPYKEPTKRPVVAKATVASMGSGRYKIQEGVSSTNPHHHWGNKLESLQRHNTAGYKPDAPTITRKGPGRDIVNHQGKEDRVNYHSHMGASKAGHMICGSRIRGYK